MTNVLQRVLAELRNALAPFERAGDPFVRDAILAAFELPLETTATLPSLDLQPIADYLANPDPQLDDFLDVAEAVIAIATSLRTFVDAAFVGPEDPQEAMTAGLQALAIGWLQRRQRVTYCLARALRIIERELNPAKREQLFPERVIPLITDSEAYFRSRFPLQTEADAKATSDAIFVPLVELADLLASRITRRTNTHVRAMYGRDAPAIAGAPAANALFERTLVFPVTSHDENTGADTTILLTAILVPAVHGGPGLLLRFEGVTVTAPLGDDWTLKANLGSVTSLSFWWLEGKGIVIDAPASAAVEVEIARTPDPAREPLVLPIAGNSRFEIGDVDFKLSAKANEIDAKITVHQASLLVGKDSSDSFSGSKMPSAGVRGDFELILGISSVRGVYLGGTAGISATIPINKDIGPLHLDTLTLDIRPDLQKATIRVSAGLSLTLEVGPVTAVVEGIGIRLNVSFPESGGNLGVADLRPAFQWPRGIGVTIEAGAVTGGGYIYFDSDNGRYAGVLQLEMQSFSIKAIGLLDTKLPGGQKGFSFLIIISAEFSPISLAMGFTLNGVGGLAGIHRTIAVEPLQAGVRNHAVDDILFPEDPVKNAPRIISDLQRFFPPVKGRYVFGPMALIGWGSPTLLTIELGIIIEVPKPVRIVLLGQLNCALPTPDSAIIELHVDILGVLDFGAKLFSLDGVIHDSRIGPFALYGDFAVRVRWGSESAFAISVGGFHPRFPLPANFPSLRRITLALGESNNPRLTMQCYFAITSNSLQFGSRADLYASAGNFSVSGWIGFDVLILFRPFSLRADLSAGFALRRGKRDLGGIYIEATLTGPGPWHLWGSASITVLCWDVSVDFEVTIGNAPVQSFPSTDIWVSLKPAIESVANWSAVLPPAASRVVTLTSPAGAALPLLDPVGRITMTERIAPLRRTIGKFAEGVPSGVRRFDLDTVTVKVANLQQTVSNWTDVTELFPPAQVDQLSDDEKLSRPSFEKMAAGMSFPDLVTVGASVGIGLAYQTLVVDSPVESHAGLLYHLSAGALDALARAGAAAKGGIRNTNAERYVRPTPRKAVLAEETFVIASAVDLTRRVDLALAGTKGAVTASLAEHITAHPEDSGKLLVVPEAEAA